MNLFDLKVHMLKILCYKELKKQKKQNKKKIIIL